MLKNACLGMALMAGYALAQAQSMPEGFLCCNMRADSSGWISDANYLEPGIRVLRAGTPMKVTGYGRHRVVVESAGEKFRLGNDYSRDVELEQFAARYVVAADPRVRLAQFPAKIQEAIKTFRVAVGMTQEQVLMAVGYPISSENPTLSAPFWKYWLTSFEPFTVIWTADGTVKAIEADTPVRSVVVQE